MHRRCFVKKDFVKHFAMFKGKPVLESLFNRVTGMRPATLLKETPTHVFPCEYWESFKNNTCFEEHLRTAASVHTNVPFLYPWKLQKISEDIEIEIENGNRNWLKWTDQLTTPNSSKSFFPRLVFFCEFCEISKNTFLHRTPMVAASCLILTET